MKEISEETREKLSKAKSGENHPNFGKHHSTETKAKISAAEKGKVISEETRAKLSESLKGGHLSEETKARMSLSHMGEKNINFGRTFSPEHCARISAAKKGENCSTETREKISKAHLGDKNSQWQGGISYEPYCPLFNENLRQRVRAYFDNQCVLCGKTKEENIKNLSVHHIEYNKNACCDGKLVQFAALCHSCHSKTNSNRGNWEEILHNIVNEIYNGRSYFTKEEWIEFTLSPHRP
jgi:hypothetical protein